MQPFSTISERLSRVPPFVKLLVLIGIVSLVAIFVFSVAVGTVTNYALLALFWGGHMFMHGSRRGHGSHSSHQGREGQNASASPTNVSPNDTNASDPKGQDHSSHAGGCH